MQPQITPRRDLLIRHRKSIQGRRRKRLRNLLKKSKTYSRGPSHEGGLFGDTQDDRKLKDSCEFFSKNTYLFTKII